MTPYCLARAAYSWQHRSPKKSRSYGGRAIPLGRDAQGDIPFPTVPLGNCPPDVVLHNTSTGKAAGGCKPNVIAHPSASSVLGAERPANPEG